MERWDVMYGPSSLPTPKAMAAFAGGKLWMDLSAWLRASYAVGPRYSFCRDADAGQCGWNVKYVKGGQTLCTLYPMDGSFIAQVVIGAKEAPWVESRLKGMSPGTREAYRRTAPGIGGRWLMLEVKNADTLRDVKWLIEARRAPRRH